MYGPDIAYIDCLDQNIIDASRLGSQNHEKYEDFAFLLCCEFPHTCWHSVMCTIPCDVYHQLPINYRDLRSTCFWISTPSHSLRRDPLFEGLPHYHLPRFPFPVFSLTLYLIPNLLHLFQACPQCRHHPLVFLVFQHVFLCLLLRQHWAPRSSIL